MGLSDENENNTLFEVVDENDKVVSLEEKEKILKEGLLRRVAHVWFFTPRGEIIFQHRAPDKDIFPDLLDATVGGKVEPGVSYEDTALHETEEETGLTIKKEDLVLLEKIRVDFIDVKTNFRNNIFTTQFAYFYQGEIKDLKIEQGKIIGFEAVPIDKLFNLSQEEKQRFIRGAIDSPEFLRVLQKIKGLLLQA